MRPALRSTRPKPLAAWTLACGGVAALCGAGCSGGAPSTSGLDATIDGATHPEAGHPSTSAHGSSRSSSRDSASSRASTSQGGSASRVGSSSESATSSGRTASSAASSSTGSSASSSSVGSSGTASSSASSSADAGPPPSASVLQKGNDLYRRATYVEPGLTLATVPTMSPDATFNASATFPSNGSIQNKGSGSVLYLEEGPTAAGCPVGASGCTASTRAAGSGLFFAFPALSSSPNVVAFDETSGKPVWTAYVTTGSDGVRGTPVIDPTARRLYLVTGNDPHLVHALSVDTGVEVTTGGWPVTLSNATVSYNGWTFNSQDQNQHGALLLANGILYIPFGGEYGDGGQYRGWVVAVDTAQPTQVAGWATDSVRSGIWGSGGLVSDGTSVFAVTGDTGVRGGAGVPRNQSDSQEVVRLTGMASFSRAAANVFVPTAWMAWDEPQGDLDFGASTPTYVPLPAGSTPSALLIAPAKAGRVYFLDANNLSSGTYDPTNRTPGGELAQVLVSSQTIESVYTTATVYTSASGLHAAINVGEGGLYCPSSTPASTEMIVSLRIQPGGSPLAKIDWCAPVASGGHHLNYPPISTTSDGVSADALVWFMDGSQLVAVDGDTGARVYTADPSACTNVPSMSWPIAVKNRVVVSALGHLCSWSAGGG